MYKLMNNCVFFFTLLKTKRNIHRGELLEAVVQERSVNISQMVKRMGISRGTYYNDRINPGLSYERLAAYGKVLKHEFSQDLPDMKRMVLEENEPPYKKPKTFTEAIEQRDYWREKYYQLMEKYLMEVKGQG